jgi:hypothetical protein
MKVSDDGKRWGSWWELPFNSWFILFGGFGGKEKSEEEFNGKTCKERCEDDEPDIHDCSPSELSGQWEVNVFASRSMLSFILQEPNNHRPHFSTSMMNNDTRNQDLHLSPWNSPHSELMRLFSTLSLFDHHPPRHGSSDLLLL